MYRDQYMKSSLKSVTAPRRSFIRPELIVEPSVPSYPVDNLPFVPKSTDCLARRVAWVFAPFDHPHNITYVLCHLDAPIFCSHTADPITTGRAIIPDLTLTSAEHVPDWQGRFFWVPGSPCQPAAAVSAGGGEDGSSALGLYRQATHLHQTMKRRIVGFPHRSARWLTPLVASRPTEASPLVSLPSAVPRQAPEGTPDHSFSVVVISHAFMSSFF
ncbi:hypothetical protein JG688_00016945 [Phytophthora aleatoria]|uniref:Uncharacterized protein n=1 Tax=Phytophthora aleatoria TaxID=2496075 RepID=A0A8J5MC34_9STRA|nr:hypothetical protein JG688_00016945 [Phytophthora aleatoria]